VSVVTIAELVHGAYRTKTQAQQQRRLEFIERLSNDVPVYPVTLDVALLVGRIEGQQEALGIQLLADTGDKSKTHRPVLRKECSDRRLGMPVTAGFAV
jgi:predicted nucleic acid-binding protein